MNELVDQYNNTYHCFINKNPIDADYSVSTEKTETNPKAPRFKVNDRVRITNIIIFLVNVILKNCQEKYSLLILFWKLILGPIKLRT